ncbi:hypothetical protein TNCV_74461 [Trichonephila clavipes]|nr:hypothetical protein TNCV_74461 [Trichonephila clavipes]
MLLLQGVVQKPVEKWFWSKRPILSTPFFGKVMADMMEVKAKKRDSVKLKPKAVVFYNNTMGGVDRSDQCLSYYPVARNNSENTTRRHFDIC